nr:endonuclease V [Candidatus Bathyarchaeota archaeon]
MKVSPLKSTVKPRRVNLEKLRAIQVKLAERVAEEDCFSKLENVCGLDVSYSGSLAVACAVTLGLDGLSVVEQACVVSPVYFPYIPTFLSFRELPPLLKAIRLLKGDVDVFMVDANGVLHPYFLGAASHLGVLIDKPTVGVAKKLLCGKPLKPRRTSLGVPYTPISFKGRTVGASVQFNSARPVYVSVGHKVSLETAINLTFKLSRHRVPEPIRMAHIASRRHASSLRNAPRGSTLSSDGQPASYRPFDA